jgi:hypothetical protein
MAMTRSFTAVSLASLLIVVGSARSASADELPAAVLAPSSNVPLTDRTRSARAMRTSGIVLTTVGILGGVAVMAGAYGLSAHAGSAPYTITLFSGTFAQAIGLSAGIPLWIVGQRRLGTSSPSAESAFRLSASAGGLTGTF